MPRSLDNPSMEIDDVPISYLPNSLSYKKGRGEKSVRPQTAGGNSIETVVGVNAETKKSMVKFKLANTAENFDYADSWLDNVVGVSIRLSQGTIVENFRQMVTTTEPEFMTGPDGEIELEFEGMPVL